MSTAGLACLAAAVACLAVGLVALRALRRRLELIARAEHELRGPATALTLACERIRRDPTAAPHADVLEAQLERLRAGLADLGAARRGRRAAGGSLSHVELAPFVQAALEPWRVALRRCSLDWRAGPATALTDRGRLAQALGNLLANSAEHGAGELDVRARRVPGGIRLELRNRNRPPVEASHEGERDVVEASHGGEPDVIDASHEGERNVIEASHQGEGGVVKARRTGRGNGVAIASQAARDLGGRLLVDVGTVGTLAVLELPEQPASGRTHPSSADHQEPGSGTPGPDLAA